MTRAQIALVDKKDLPEIEKLIAEQFPYTRADFHKVKERFAKPNVYIYKIVAGKRIIGFVDLELRESQQQGLYGFLTAIAVKPEYRGHGYAGRLMDFAIDFFRSRQINEVKLIVKSRNAQAKKLYKRFGFVKQRSLKQKIDNALVDEFALKFPQENIGYAA